MSGSFHGRRRSSGKGKTRSRRGRHGGVHGAERLERRSMFAGAQPFVPLFPAGPPAGVDPQQGGQLYDQASGTTYYNWYDAQAQAWKWADGNGLPIAAPPSTAVRVDAAARPIALPLNQAAQQSWVLADGSTLVLFGSSVGSGSFRRYDASGGQVSWPTVFDGRVKDVLQTPDQGFLVWGNVADRAEAGWIRGGFDTTYNGAVDGYVAKLDSNGLLVWATLVGGAGMDTVESAAVSPDGGTIFVVGDTSSSGGFVNGTGDQVLDRSSKNTISIGRDDKGSEIVSQVTGQIQVTTSLGQTATYTLNNDEFAGTAGSVNGFVMVLSGDGTKHVWSSYLSPQDDRNLPLSGAKFLATGASFVTEVEVDDATMANGVPGVRAGIIVTQDGGGAGSPGAATSGLVTLVEVPAGGKNLQTGAFHRDFRFKSIATVDVPDVFYTSVKSRPLGGDLKSRYYYYMTAVSAAEQDTVAYNPLLEANGRPGTPSRRSIGRLQFSVGLGGDVQVAKNFFLEVSSFSLTSFFPTPDAIYLTGTTLSNRPLAWGPQVGGYHTYPFPVKGDEVGNNYGDAVLVELRADGTPVRTQIVGNVAGSPATPLLDPPSGLKEKGGAIAVVRNADGTRDVRLLGMVHAQPASGQSVTPPLRGSYWTYRDATVRVAAASAAPAATVAAPVAPAAAAVAAAPPTASASTPTVQWTGYIGTAGADGVSDAWSIPKTSANGLPDNQVVLQNLAGGRSGLTASTLSTTNWNDGIQGTVAQIQLNADATKLYAAGTTVTAGWTSQGFDTSLSQYTVVGNSGQGPTVPSYDGFFARVNVASGRQDYSTYLGGNGESFRGNTLFSNGYRDDVGPGAFVGNDYSNAFYIDPNAPVDQGTALIVGRSNARSGLGSKDGVTDQPQQQASLGRPWPGSSFDDIRSLGQDARPHDATIYTLNDHPNGVGAKPNQLDWAAYLSPRDIASPVATPDNEGGTIPYLIMQNADFVWRAKDASGIGNLVYVFGDDIDGAAREVRNGEVRQGPVQKAVYVFNDAKVNDRELRRQFGIQSLIKKSLDVYWTTPDQISVTPTMERPDGTTGPSVFFRDAGTIRRIDLPTVASWDRPMAGVTVAWTKGFPAGNDIRPAHMAISGNKIYVASTTRQYTWENFIQPLPGKYRNGPSDAVLLQLDAVKAGNVDWWMLQGGDGADTGTAVAAFPDGRVMLLGQTSSKPSETNTVGWVGTSVTAAMQLGNKQMSPLSSRRYFGGATDAFTVVVQTANSQAPVSKAEIDIGGVVNGQVRPIASGSATPSALQGTDFGTVIVQAAAVERTFEIANRGTEPLVLSLDAIPAWTAMKVGGAPLASTLAPGASTRFTLVFNPTAVGTFTGDVIISSNDANEDVYTFALQAVVITPPPSTLSVEATAAAIVEGNTGTKPATFTVRLVPGTPAPVYPVQVSYATVADTAKPGSDYASTSGILTFAAGETTKTVSVPVLGDLTPEFDETFKLVLSNPTGRSVISPTAGEASVAITTDDGTPQPPTIGFRTTTVSVVEGGTGTRSAVPLTVRLLQPETTDVTVRYSAVSGSAASGTDFVAAAGTVTIPAGSTEATFNVTVIGDAVAEPTEQFTVRLSNATAGAVIDQATATITITNDDGDIGPPPLRVANAQVVEGNSGSPLLVFTITLSKPSSTDIVLSYSTVDGTALAGRDYRAVSGTVTIRAGRTTARVSVPVIANRVVDGNRTVQLRVSSGGKQMGVGVGTILDDDRARLASAFASLAAGTPGGTTKK